MGLLVKGNHRIYLESFIDLLGNYSNSPPLTETSSPSWRLKRKMAPGDQFGSHLVCVWLVGFEPTTFLLVIEKLYPLSYSHTHAKVSPDYNLLNSSNKILWIEISCVKSIAISSNIDVRVYALSQGRASPDVIVLSLSHRDAQDNLSYKKEPRREISGALLIY